jgi:hypothetical protein
VECERDLDWAQPEFVERHPAPRCWPCKDRPRQLVYASREGRQLTGGETPTRAEVFKAMRPGNWFFNWLRRWTV